MSCPSITGHVEILHLAAPHEAAVFKDLALQMRPHIVGDGEIHDNDGAGKDQVEVPNDPLGVVDAGIELVAHVDEPGVPRRHLRPGRASHASRSAPSCARGPGSRSKGIGS